MPEPEVITILEGPTPDFQPATAPLLLQSVLEGPNDAALAVCEMRTNNGDDIRERCLRAWNEGRPVILDFPDELRLRQQVDVAAMRVDTTDLGAKLVLWVRWALEAAAAYDEEDFDHEILDDEALEGDEVDDEDDDPLDFMP